MTGRAQTFTLEAFVAAILLLAAVAFALQVVSISANTASAGDTEDGAQHAGLAAGVLDESIHDGSLERTLLYWDAATGGFHGAADEDDGFYVARPPPSAAYDGDSGFNESLDETFGDRRVRYNVDLYYTNETGAVGHQRLVESGTPSDDAVRVVETVTLYDDTRLVDENGTRGDTLSTVADDEHSTVYVPDAHVDSPLYNVVRVEVTLWRT